MSQAPPQPSEQPLQTSTPDLHIDAVRRVVTLRGRVVALGGRAFDLLVTLAARPGRVFTADELLQAVWPGRVVEEANLRAQIHKLRQSIGSHRIANVSGRGYAYATTSGGPMPAPAPNSLPRPATELLGRDEDRAAVGELIARCPLVTLLGTGGVGKTQLALALARQTQAAQPDNVWWVDLSSLRSVERIAAAIAQTLGLQPGVLEGPDAGSRLGAALAGHEGLLVLDNAEHAAAPLAELLQDLLPLAPGLALLVTSQQRLQLSGEQVYRLEPLEPQSALQLLLRRAQAVDHRFRLESHELEAAARLCQQLDRLPLALEMAGARLPMLGLPALQQHLGQRLALLGTEQAGVPARQRSLQSALAWSHAMLSADEQAVLRRLAVFAAPFRLDSAQIVAADAALDAVAVARAVAVLVDKSLLQVHAPDGGAPQRRWRLLETPRLFAAQQLDAHHERAATEARHAQAMAALADAALETYRVAGDSAWMRAWSADHDDFLLGFDRACAMGDADAASRLGEALEAQANITGLYAPLLQRVDASLALLPQGGPLARARLWNRTVWPSVHLSRTEAARRRLQAWRLAGEPAGLAEALGWCAFEETLAGEAAASDSLMTELRAVDPSNWTPRQRMGTVFPSVMILLLRNDPLALRAAVHEWLQVAQQGGQTRQAVQAVCLQAFDDALDGRLGEALLKFQQTVAEHRAMGSFSDTAVMLGHQAMVTLQLNDRATARDLLEQALMITDDVATIDRLCANGATLALANGQAPLAERLLAAATGFARWQISPASAWERQVREDTRAALDRQLDDATRERCRAEGARLSPAEAHRLMLDWLRSLR